MKDQLVSKFTLKFVWDDNDEAFEHWMEDMARQGLHLQRVDCLRSRFVFKRGEPADMTYRVDYRINKVSAEYLQLFADAGWERVDSSVGWQIWRTPTRAGRTPEIFTDTASRIAKYKRMLWLFLLCYGVFFYMLFDQGARRWDTPLEIVLHLILTVIALYSTARLLLRIRKLRNSDS